MEHRLNFLDEPHLREGPNTTFRLGSKWYVTTGLEDIVHIHLTSDAEDDDPIADGEITNVTLTTFKDIAIKDVMNCCCKDCNDSISRLALSMIKAYPEEFNLDSEVTVLEFEIIPEEEE